MARRPAAGLYELLYLGGAPDHAVLADAVELVKSGGGAARPPPGPAAEGTALVNAALRRARREGAAWWPS